MEILLFKIATTEMKILLEGLLTDLFEEMRNTFKSRLVYTMQSENRNQNENMNKDSGEQC